MKLRFVFRSDWKAPIIPVVKPSDEWIAARKAELATCFEELNERLLNVNTAECVSFGELKTALHVIGTLHDYRNRLDWFNRDDKSESEKSKAAKKVYTTSVSHEITLGKRII